MAWLAPEPDHCTNLNPNLRARKSSPAGKENWTWDELRVGSKNDRTQRFHLKMLRGLEQAKPAQSEDGRANNNIAGHEAAKTSRFSVVFLFVMVIIGPT
jgi:hypothetical protein